jgi:hypothetical protein
MAKTQPIEHSNALRKESNVREEKTCQLSQQKRQAFSRHLSFANFIKPKKSDKSWRYEKRENTRDGLTKRLIAEEVNRKNASSQFHAMKICTI